MRISDWGSDVCSSDLDVLINNAGVFEANPIETADADWLSGWERTLDINLTAAALLCRRAVLHWREGGRDGRIVNIASRAAYRGDSPEHWHYAASQRSEEHTSELPSLMRISYAVFCLNKTPITDYNTLIYSII